MKIYLLGFFTLFSLLSISQAVTDQNICAEACQFCCRDQVCRSQQECQGNYQPFIILGCVIGGIIGLFIMRRIYVHYRNKNLIARGIDPKAKNKNGLKDSIRSRWRRKAKSPSKEKSGKSREKSTDRKKKRPASKTKSMKSDDGQKPSSRGEIYLQIDNESVLSGGQDINSTKNLKGNPVSSRNDTSKVEILINSNTNVDKKSLNNLENKPKSGVLSSARDKENSIVKKDKPVGTAGKSSTGNKPAGKSSGTTSTKKPAASSRDVNTSQRGRSKEPAGNNNRASSQKKPTSSGPTGGKSRGNSAGAKKK